MVLKDILRFRSILFALAVSAAATATPLFPPVTVSHNFNGTTVTDNLDPFAVGPEIECTGGGTGTFGNGQVGTPNVCTFLTSGVQTIDFEDQEFELLITYTYTEEPGNPASFGGTTNILTFSDLNFGEPIKGVILNTTIDGLDLSRVTFTDTSVIVDMVGLALDADETFQLQVYTTPEPSSGLLAAAGALLLAGGRRWRKRRRS